MKENTVYLLYNTNANEIRLSNRERRADFEIGIRNKEWEYEDKDEFTIEYSPDDERHYTDIKILSKTRLRERPKSAEQLIKKPKVGVEGYLIRRANSLPSIEEDYLLIRRSPLIKPLLSETEIFNLQLLLEECRKRKQDKYKKIVSDESSVIDGLEELLAEDQDFRKMLGVSKDPQVQEKIKVQSNKLSSLNLRNILSASPSDVEGSQPKEKTTKKSNLFKNEKSGKNKFSEKYERTFILGKKSQNDGYKKIQTRPSTITSRKTKENKFSEKWESTSTSGKKLQKDGDKKNETSTARKAKENKNTKLHPMSKKHSKLSVGKHRPNAEVENNNKRMNKNNSPKSPSSKKKSIKNPHKPNEGINEKLKIEKLSDQDKLNASSEKTLDSEQKESNKKNLKTNGDSKSKEDKNKLKTKTEKERNLSATDSLTKSNKSEKSKLLNKVEQIEKGKKDAKKTTLSISFSNKENVSQGKAPREKNNNLDDDPLGENPLQMKKESPSKNLSKYEDGKSTNGKQKSSPSDKTIKSKKSKGSETETVSTRKGKNKKKSISGLLQYMIHYILSNPIFLKLGWTLQPTEKALSRIVTFKAVHSNPQSYCFRSRDKEEQKWYPSGAPALKIMEDGTGRLNYPCGYPAMRITGNKSGMRLTLYSCPTKDPLVKESFYTRIIGMFDSFGNGVVYHKSGKEILRFNQMEGVYNNPDKKTPYKWQWSSYKELEAQQWKELLKAVVNEVKQPTTPTKGTKPTKIPTSGNPKKTINAIEKKPVDKMYEELLAELPYPAMPKSKRKITSHESVFKSIILKINDQITLRINGQGSVVVHFSADKFFYKMDVGVRVDPEVVERVDEVAGDRVSGSVPCILCDSLHPSPSLQNLHKLLDPDTLV